MSDRHRIHQVHQVPYSAREMFNMVMDVNRYPEFVPGWQKTQIEHSEANKLNVAQRVGLPGLHFKFHSVVSYSEPRYLSIEAIDGPFRKLQAHWYFEAVDSGCKVTFKVWYEMRGTGAVSRFLNRVGDPWLRRMSRRVARAFMHRADQLYGHREIA